MSDFLSGAPQSLNEIVDALEINPGLIIDNHISTAISTIVIDCHTRVSTSFISLNIENDAEYIRDTKLSLAFDEPYQIGTGNYEGQYIISRGSQEPIWLDDSVNRGCAPDPDYQDEQGHILNPEHITWLVSISSDNERFKNYSAKGCITIAIRTAISTALLQ